MNRIITIGREFGSGGRELGRRLSEKLGIAYYDQEIMTEIANRTELSEQYVQRIVEHKPILSFPIHTGRTLLALSTANRSPLEQNLEIFREQTNIIREMAQNSDCVIVGRCADYVLHDAGPLRVFVYADLESRLQRCLEKAPPEEHRAKKDLRQHITEVDRHRAKYYAFYTGQRWGDRHNYDICINTARISIYEWVEVLEKLV